jgi:hypothetical protein
MQPSHCSSSQFITPEFLVARLLASGNVVGLIFFPETGYVE